MRYFRDAPIMKIKKRRNFDEQNLRQVIQKLQQPESDIRLDKIRQLEVKYSSQKLSLTTLREFLELFVSSISNDEQFHFEIFGAFYHYVGLSFKDCEFN